MSSTPWWKSGIIYQIYPRSFQDSGHSGIGTIGGITHRLNYLAELGVSAIWVSPFFESPMHDFGYDITNHRAVDPMFGTDDDFDELIKEAHVRGIRILIDLVLSHTSIRHPWFLESRQGRDTPTADYYVWADAKPDGTPPTNWLSIFGGVAWTWEPRREQYYLHNFLDTQPDLNFHHPAVQDEALAIAEYWLDRGVDGFRLDTVNFYFHDQSLRDNPPNALSKTTVVSRANPYGYQNHLYDKNRPEVAGFLSRLGDLLSRYPDRVALGEVGAEWDRATQLIQEYVQPGRIQLCYSFDLLSDEFSAEHFRNYIQKESLAAEGLWRCVAFSNHDVARTASRLRQPNSESKEIASLSMALLLSLKGTPCIYQGEELGLPEVEVPFERLVDPYGIKFYPQYKGRDGCRTPMPWTSNQVNCGFTDVDAEPWLPISADHTALAVSSQLDDEHSMLSISRSLIAFRQSTPAFAEDALRLLPGTNQRLEFIRGDGANAVYCAFNLSSTADTYRPDNTMLKLSKPLCAVKEFEYIGDHVRLPAWGWTFVRCTVLSNDRAT